MQINDLLAQMGGVPSMARELGVSEAEAAQGAAALLPSILGGFKKRVDTDPQGGDGLGGLLSQLGGGSLLDNVLSPDPTPVSKGNEILGNIFGSKDVSRAVAQGAATNTGLNSTLLKKMLPILAMAVAGYMSRQQRGDGSTGGGGLGGLLGSLLGRGGGTSGGHGGLLGMLGDRNPLDDVMRSLGRS